MATPSACKYLIDKRLCKAIMEGEEGKAVREESCINDSKELCCYLCSYRDICDISCTYLDRTEKLEHLEDHKSVQSGKINLEIMKCKAKIQKLADLFAKGQIGEGSFAVTAKTLENRLKGLRKSKENTCVQLPDSEFSYRGFRESLELEDVLVEKPTALWYLVPFLFGILGGVVAYVATKEEDKEMADRLLGFGVIWTVFLMFISGLVIDNLLKGRYF